ncbi:MAG: hypothetical protein WBN41_17415, partial [Lysobacterales bacterium]
GETNDHQPITTIESIMKNFILISALCLTTALLSVGSATAQHQTETSRLENQEMFFSRIKSLCGSRFEGRSVFPQDPGDAFRDKLLVAVVETCNADEIRIPFIVGKDHPRTWILKKTSEGLQFKHDHRHEDGTPDKVTLYGGTATGSGTQQTQSFPADDYTAKLIPEASTNEWFLSLSDDNNEMVYYLERHNKARFKAILKRVP